ncbi:MAG TPA: hypothetical protein VGG85_13305 [Terracidiphilus sp.]|jgi:hypothetical protein
MSQFTFDIANYRPLSALRTHKTPERNTSSMSAMRQSGFVVVTSNPEADERENLWLEAQPAVVDIRPVRTAQRTRHLSLHGDGSQGRGKVIRFTSDSSPRVQVMPMSVSTSRDTDPINFPPAA